MWGWGDFHTVHSMYLWGKSPGLKYNPQYFYVNAAKQGGVGWAAVSFRHLGLQEANLLCLPLALDQDCSHLDSSPEGQDANQFASALGLKRKWAGRYKRSQTGDLNNFISQHYDSTPVTLSSLSTSFLLPSFFCPAQPHVVPRWAKNSALILFRDHFPLSFQSCYVNKPGDGLPWLIYFSLWCDTKEACH